MPAIYLQEDTYPDVYGTAAAPVEVLAGSYLSLVIYAFPTNGNPAGSIGVSMHNHAQAGSGFSNAGTPSGAVVWNSSVLGGELVGNTLAPINFYATQNGVVFYHSYNAYPWVSLQSGRVWFKVVVDPSTSSHHTPTGVSFAADAAPNITATISTSGGSGTLQTSSLSPQVWSNGNTQVVTRGQTYSYYARSYEFAQSNTSYAAPIVATTPYLSADLSISASNANTNTAGAWISNLSNITGTYNNYALADSHSATGATFYYSDSTYPALGSNIMMSGINGTAFNVGEYSGSQNSPAPGSSRTYYVWGKRYNGSGGDGQWHPTSASFTVTASSPVIPAECTNSSGTWFDTDSSFNPKTTRASFRYLNPYRVYMIARQDSGGSWEFARNGWAGISAETSYTFQDPLSVTDTQRTYSLFSNTSSTLVGATQELTFTRTEKNPRVTEPTSIPIAIAADSYTVTLEDTVSGFTYYIKDSASSGATSVAGVLATGTTTSIPVTGAAFMPGEAGGSTTTVYVWVQAPLNLMNTTSQTFGDSISIVRGSESEEGGEDPAVTPGDYGMIVRDASNNIIVDTTSRFGRIVGSSNLSGILTSGVLDVPINEGGTGQESWVQGAELSFPDSGWSEWRNVAGITDDHNTWHVIVHAVFYDNYAGGYGADYHYVELSDGNGGQFRVRNVSQVSAGGAIGATTSIAAKYEYNVVRTRG